MTSMRRKSLHVSVSQLVFEIATTLTDGLSRSSGDTFFRQGALTWKLGTRSKSNQFSTNQEAVFNRFSRAISVDVLRHFESPRIPILCGNPFRILFERFVRATSTWSLNFHGAVKY
ncbi:uncharacterized protein EURHEDRAFT_171375 [Aspergillus ruber CBS 135680]|uniref:Uncharacterized protein n=1 Tax=Aspergillus ruber (strain CBS 135680) TaxID=1388766 RepID=A0A017S7I4_ASPRC|nr:uncharacterized protein EURHEDRAFT_171375 [Aspergillus ruber CBS 135680]EYE92927.1 hypothetical protein EURHEDRAFT_171375 [Aspergillus ruber CBS 135680]